MKYCIDRPCLRALFKRRTYVARVRLTRETRVAGIRLSLSLSPSRLHLQPSATSACIKSRYRGDPSLPGNILMIDFSANAPLLRRATRTLSPLIRGSYAKATLSVLKPKVRILRAIKPHARAEFLMSLSLRRQREVTSRPRDASLRIYRAQSSDSRSLALKRGSFS